MTCLSSSCLSSMILFLAGVKSRIYVVLRGFILILLLHGSSTAHVMDFSYPNFNSTNGLQSNVVHHVMQDSEGYIWLGTDSGVSRFDGSRFRHYTTADGLGGNEIFQIYEDSRGRLWFLSFNGIPSFYQNRTFHNPGNTPWLDEMQFDNMHVSVFEDPEGTIWLFGLDRSIYTVDSNDRVEQFPSTGVQETARQGWMDHNGTLFLGSSLKTYRFDTETRQWTVYSDHPHRYIQRQHTADGDFLIPASHGIISTGRNETARYYLTREQLGLSHNVTSVIKGRESIYMAVGTYGDGVHFYHYEGSETRRKVSQLLPGKRITSLAFDNQESLWIATLDNGVYRVDRSYSGIENIAATQHLHDVSIRSTLKSRDGTLLFGTSNGNLIALKNGLPLTLRNADAVLSGSSIEDLEELSDGRLAIITASALVMATIDENGWMRQLYRENLPGKTIIEIGDNLFLGTVAGLYRMDAYDLQNKTQIMEKRITALESGPRGILWAGTIHGLHLFDQRGRELIVPEAFENEQITCIEYLFNGWAAIATHGSGVIFYQPVTGEVLRLNADNGLPDNLVRTMVYDNSQLWIASSAGLTLIPLIEQLQLERQLEMLPSGVQYYSGELFGAQIGRIQPRADDVILAGNNLLVALQRTEPGASRIQIPLIMEEVLVNGERVEPDENHAVKHRQNQWTFDYTGILFRNADRLRYRYRLVESGVQSGLEWTISTASSVTYRSVPPGDYRFEVEAFTPDGTVYSHREAVFFSIRRPLWMQPLVWLLTLLIVSGGLFVLFRYRVNQVQLQEKQKHEFKRTVNELEQQALQAMMSPHFVFNILNNIHYQIMLDDKEKASGLLLSFSKLIRKQLETAYQRSTSLKEELERLELYTRIESTRLANPIAFSALVADNIDTITTRIPSMILQPFVENAIIHGIAHIKASGEIRIHIERAASGQILVTVTDNGAGIRHPDRPTAETDRLSLGTTLVRQRLEIMAQENAMDWDVQIQNMTGEDGSIKGVKAQILLPVR